MDLEIIRGVLHRRPFVPFTLRLADGRALHVPHRELVAMSSRQVIVIDPDDESLTHLTPLLIQSIETE